MTHVRIASAAEALLPYCRPWSGRVQDPCFTTYAEMTVFAAGIGYWKARGAEVAACSDFIENTQPYPIDFSVFKSPTLYPIVLMLGLVTCKSRNAVADDERLARALEDYSAIGFSEMKNRLASTTPTEFHIELAELLLKASA